MLTRDEIAVLIPWYVNGTLGPGDRARVEEHLPECPDCRELLGMMREVRDAASTVGIRSLMQHVDPTLLHDLVFDPQLLERDIRKRVEGHLGECEECRGERDGLVELRNALDREDRAVSGVRPLGDLRSLPRRSLQQPVVAAGLAAAVMLLVLAVPAYRGLYELPSAREQASDLRGEVARIRGEMSETVGREREAFERRLQSELAAAAHGGLAELHYLSEAPRTVKRGGEVPEVRIEAGQAMVAFAVALDPVVVPSLEGRYRVEIVRDTQVVWSTVLAGRDIRRYVDLQQNAPVLLVPTAILGAGTFDLRLTSEEGSEGDLFKTTFKIIY